MRWIDSEIISLWQALSFVT